jgi:hypothetical protein
MGITKIVTPVRICDTYPQCQAIIPNDDLQTLGDKRRCSSQAKHRVIDKLGNFFELCESHAREMMRTTPHETE